MLDAHAIVWLAVSHHHHHLRRTHSPYQIKMQHKSMNHLLTALKTYYYDYYYYHHHHYHRMTATAVAALAAAVALAVRLDVLE